MRTDHDNGALMRRSTNSNNGQHGERQSPTIFDPFNPTDSLLSPSLFFTASPFQLMRRMQEDMDRLFGQVLGSGYGSGNSSALWAGGSPTAAAGQQQGVAPFFTPHMDVSETDKDYHLEVDLPGVSEDAIDIEVKGDNALIIRAEVRQESGEGNDPQGQDQQEAKPQKRQYHYRERRYGRFERVLSLPQNVDPQNIAANFQNGVLTVTLPKREQTAPQGRRIPIGGMAASPQEPRPMVISQATEPEPQVSAEGQNSTSADNMATASNAAPSSHRKNGKKLAHAAAGSSASGS